MSNKNIDSLKQNLHKYLDEISSIIESINELDFINDKASKGKTNDIQLKNYILEVRNITDMLDDNTFRVGIVGEFSCGKSTFINAFIEKRYLVEDITQGTTCSSTVISYGEKDQVVVRYKGGSTRKLNMTGVLGVFQTGFRFLMNRFGKKPVDEEQRLRDFLEECTANEEKAQNIHEVEWISPIPALQDGFVIVDTPGIGSQNPRHTEVAKEAAERCDALLVLMNLQAGQFSRELVTAVKEIAGPTALKCIFVGTQLDGLPAREHARMHDFFQKKILSCFGSPRAYYMVAALDALEELEGSEGEKTKGHAALDTFRAFRQDVHALLSKRRQHLKCQETSALVGKLLQDLKAGLSSRQALLARSVEEYKRAILRDDSPYWDSAHRALLSDFSYDASNIENAALSKVRESVLKLQRDMNAAIDACPDEDALEQYLKTGINDTIGNYKTTFGKLVEECVRTPLYQAARVRQQAFSDDLQEHYAKMKKVGGKVVSLQGSQTCSLPAVDHNLGQVMVDYGEPEEELDFVTGVLGTILLPVFIIGFILEWLFRSLESRKKEAKEKVAEYIAKTGPDLHNKVLSLSRNMTSEFSTNLDSIFTRSKQEYRQTVNNYNNAIQQITDNMHSVINTVNAKSRELSAISQKVQSLSAILAKDML